MKRRTVLGAIGAGTIPFVGCATRGNQTTEPETETRSSAPTDTESGSPPSSTPSEPSPTATPTPTPTPTPVAWEYDPDTTYDTLSIGEPRDIPDKYRYHRVKVWNATTMDRTVTVRLTDEVAGETVLHSDFAIPADADVHIKIYEVSKYIVEIRASNPGRSNGQIIHCGDFDCNKSGEEFGVFDDVIRHNEYATLRICKEEPEC